MATVGSDHQDMDAVSLWRSLRQYLKLEIEVLAPPNPEPRSPTTVRVVATNTAPSGADWPEVVFYGVRLAVGVQVRPISRKIESPLAGRRSDRHPAISEPPVQDGDYSGYGRTESHELARGESVVWEITCPFDDLPKVQPTVDARVSLPRFFWIPQEVEIPLVYTQPKALTYIRAFITLGFHGLFQPRLDEIKIPTGSTTLAELQVITQTLATSLSVIGDTAKRLNSLAAIAVVPEARAHLEAAGKYLVEELRARQALKDAVASADPARLAEATKVFASISLLALELQRAAELLLAKYAIGGEDAIKFMGG